ncbi:MAG: response regulator [Patescibacteria group bacterium]|nr:response regulator [Patescibacteria group bacterium]
MLKQKKSTGGKASILLIESDAFLAGIYEKNLVMEDYAVAVASSGESGLKTAQKKLPDLILLSVLLPGMNGWEVLAGLKKGEKTRDIPVVMLTKLGTKEDVEKGRALGASAYIIKAHFQPSEVVDKIKKILRQ